MACYNCKSLLPISKCTESIIIGTALINTAYYILFKNLATGAIIQYNATSNAQGLITITGGEFNFATNQDYELWINADSQNPIFKSNLAIDDSINTCYTLSFIRVYDTDGIKLFTTQKLKLK